MATFEAALDDCLKRINAGELDVDGCLRLYPEYADELRPLLETAARMKPGNAGSAAPAQASSQPPAPDATTEIHHFEGPSRRRRGLSWYATPAVSAAALLFIILVALFVAATVFAQTAYPGDFLYGWKRTSENVVRVINPLEIDLAISRRRANEVLAVRNDPARLVIAWEGYREVMNRLLAYEDPAQAARIASVLRAQWEAFLNAGVPLPTGTAALPPVPTASPTPTVTGTILPTPVGAGPDLTGTATPVGPAYQPSPTRTDFRFPTSRPTSTPRPTRTPAATRTPVASPTPRTLTPLPTFTTPAPPPPPPRP